MMESGILTCVLVISFYAISATKAIVTCPSEWVPSEESATCIRLYSVSMEWSEARAACQTQGGDLVKIVNKAMNDLVAGEVTATGVYNFWIGLHDDAQENFFVWLDEMDEAEYINWADGQPNNQNLSSSEGQDCVTTGSYPNVDEWADWECDINYFYVCEIPSTTSVTCPSDWVASNVSGTCIKLHTDYLEWSEARAACQTQGADLVKIVNTVMNDLIADEIAALGGYNYWIGLHDDATENFFVWLDETTAAGYTKWASGQPNNQDVFTSAGQDCVTIATNSQLDEWGDWECDINYRYVCELPATDTSALGESSGLGAGAVAAIVLVLVALALVPVLYFGIKMYRDRQSTKLTEAVASINRPRKVEPAAIEMK